MADGGSETSLSLETVDAVSTVDPATWDALAFPGATPYNPFVSHAFLSALEQSGSVGEETGWLPRPALLKRGKEILAAAPLYLKFHSYGEYVFDHHWADAYERAGGRYYPKLLCAAPFTPAAGPRLLAQDNETRLILANALGDMAKRLGVSTLHINFVEDIDRHAALQTQYLLRAGVQYHWFNRGYKCFDDFLATLTSRKRKAVKRERREAANTDLVIRRLRGNEIEPRHWDAFWIFYQDTGARKWGSPYLTRAFFDIIADSMTDNLLMIVAERDGAPIAGALNFIGGEALYGRYWGCTEHHPFLHFELCYHQAVDFAIEHGLARVEAGAQGEHKIARGYEPMETTSLHWIADTGFREAIGDYLRREREQNSAEIEYLGMHTPFRKTSEPE